MKVRKLITLLLLLLPLASLFSEPVYAPIIGTVSDRGRFEDIFQNPAALPFKSDGRNFYISAVYSDRLSPSAFNAGEAAPFIQNTATDLILGFSAKYVSLFLAFENSLHDKTNNAYFDMYSLTHIQIDMGYSLYGFSIGGRIRGGTRLLRQNQRIANPWDYVKNAFFSSFYNTGDGQYFDVGLGLMYSSEYFSIGLVSDKVLYLDSDQNNISASLSAVLDSLSIAATLEGPRFKSDGNLRLVRPKLTLELENIMSSESVFALVGELKFQLLPRVNVFFDFGYRDLRDMDAGGTYFRCDEQYIVLAAGCSASWFSAGLEFALPTSYFSGSRTDELAFQLYARFYL